MSDDAARRALWLSQQATRERSDNERLLALSGSTDARAALDVNWGAVLDSPPGTITQYPAPYGWTPEGSMIELRRGVDVIEWRPSPDFDWRPLIQVSELKAQPGATLPVSSLHTWGHSYVAGAHAGPGSIPRTLAPALAARLGLPLVNHAEGGTLLTDSLRGWGPVMQAVTVPEADAFAPRFGLHVMMHGLNDIATFPTIEMATVVHRQALRAVVSRFRAGAIFEDSHPSVSYEGGWNVLTPYTDRNSGDSLHFTGTQGDAFTITTPADFPGGTIALGFTSWTDGPSTFQSEPINGIVYTHDNSSFDQSDTFSGSVLRIPNLPAGVGAYTFTRTSASGPVGLMLDYWSWECPADTGPVAVLVQQPRLLEYSAYSGVPPMGDAQIDALNAVIAEVAAEFGPRVVVVDTSALNARADCWVVGNNHPTVKGHDLLAEAVQTQLAEAGYAVVTGAGP